MASFFDKSQHSREWRAAKSSKVTILIVSAGLIAIDDALSITLP
jgi:hypothetical protein